MTDIHVLRFILFYGQKRDGWNASAGKTGSDRLTAKGRTFFSFSVIIKSSKTKEKERFYYGEQNYVKRNVLSWGRGNQGDCQ